MWRCASCAEGCCMWGLCATINAMAHMPLQAPSPLGNTREFADGMPPIVPDCVVHVWQSAPLPIDGVCVPGGVPRDTPSSAQALNFAQSPLGHTPSALQRVELKGWCSSSALAGKRDGRRVRGPAM
uniref:Uncharacterized protein n=1 Tax=Eutreptiella gymnastica TaxID=73025 RepID=A0A7S4G603_9EUGL